MFNICRGFSRIMNPSVLMGQARFSSEAAEKTIKNTLDRNKVVASTALGALLGFALAPDDEKGSGLITGAALGVFHGGTVVGLTRLVKGPGASAPFWILAPTMVATLGLFGSVDTSEEVEKRVSRRSQQNRTEQPRRTYSRVEINNVEVEDPEIAKEITKLTLSLTSGILKLTAGIISGVFGEVSKELESAIKEIGKDKKNK